LSLITFPFRPWIRRSCRKAMVWGVGVVALLGAVTWLFRTPGTAPLGRAFGVLVMYGLLFWLTLLKIWWTAGKPAVLLDRERLSYQPLHTFRLRPVAFRDVLWCGPRQGTESLRFVIESRPGTARELFLNLGVIDGRHEFLDELGRRLVDDGLEPVEGEQNSWRRGGWELEG
jgi:hypothetical protein